MADRYDIIKPGAGFWNGYGDDFNARFNFNPETDTIVLPAGEYGHIQFQGNFKGVKIRPDDVGTVKVHAFAFGPKGENVEVTGKNLLVENWQGRHFGVTCESTGIIDLSEFTVNNCEMGVQVTSNIETAKVAKQQVQKLSIKNLTISNVKEEGIYVGYYRPSPIPIEGVIDGCKVRKTGKDAIQFRNGRFTVINNDVEDIGTSEDRNHGHGYAYGTSSTGLIFKNNKGKRIFSCGLFSNGYGDIEIEGNDIEATDCGLYLSNYADMAEDSFKAGKQTYTFRKNRFVGSKNTVVRDPNKAPQLINIYDDNILSPQPNTKEAYGAVINRLVTAPVKEVMRKGYWVINGKRVHYTAYTDWTIENKK